ncbi:MAG: hypothetical protein DRJ44_07805, partial [Thermoprotei archaeon]
MFAEYIVRLFKKRKVDFMLTVIGFAIVFTITLMAILAPFIAPYDPYVSVDDA